MMPTAKPTSAPRPICCTRTWIKYTEGLNASSAKPMDIKRSRKGTDPPSFNPLSISMVFLIFSGTFLFWTTICPNAASVGARAAPIIPATHQGIPGNIKVATINPKIMVSGNPMVSNLVLCLFLRAFNPTRDASLKRTSTKAISAIKKIIVEYGGLETSTYPVTSHPINIPAKTNNI